SRRALRISAELDLYAINPMLRDGTSGVVASLQGSKEALMMEARRIRRVAIVLALIVLASWTMPAAQEGSSDAMAQVKSAVEKARKILADPGYKSAPQSKRTELLKLLDNNFAFDDMARSSLGSYWKKLNPDQRGRFVELFHQRLERRYVKIIEDYSGAQINFVRESPSGPDRAEVYTNVVNPMLAEPL